MDEREAKLEEVMSDDIELDSNTSLDSDVNTSEVILSDDEKHMIKLSAGQALDIQETYDITASEETKLIVLVGPSSCGKTTIIATVYQLFLRGPLGDYYFAGSKTLQGYEQRSHLSRFSSNRREPTTIRTSGGVSNLFLHLRLWNSKQGTYINLLFADVSGEDYEEYITNVDAVQEHLEFIKSANYVIAVLDGALLTDKSRRNGLSDSMAQLLLTIIDADLISYKSKLQVLFSKYDVIDTEENVNVMSYIGYCKKKYQEKFRKNFSEIELHEIAAMPQNGDKYSFGSGLDKLFLSWCKQDNQLEKGKFEKFTVCNEFNKLYFKLLGEENE